MTQTSAQNELPSVRALRSLSIFGAGQAGAYREHFGRVAEVFGPDVRTRLRAYVEGWVGAGTPGVLVLTGNAGTGKTAVAQAFCEVAGGCLPDSDRLFKVEPKEAEASTVERWVVKDLSGIPTPEEHIACMRDVMARAASSQVLVCANEGILRNALQGGGGALRPLLGELEDALRAGAAQVGSILFVNVNRQRPTAVGVWNALIAYLAHEDVWSGCEGCPGPDACPMRANAAALRKPEVRDGLRLLFRYSSGATVPTLRDVLSILAWSIIGDGGGGGLTCDKPRGVKEQVKNNGPDAYEAQNAYFSQLFGLGLRFETLERSPVLTAMLAAGLGDGADLQVDEWLRDPSAAPSEIKALTDQNLLGRVKTEVGTMSFERLGDTLSTSEDAAKVDACITALNDPAHPAMAMWRRRVFFEGAAALGGTAAAAHRLLNVHFFAELLDVAERCSRGSAAPMDLNRIIKGLNMLVTGYPNVGEGLIIPDNAGLFSRDPGAYAPARPCVVHTQVPPARFSLRCPDRGLVTQMLDVDHIEIELVAAADGRGDLSLRIGPDMYEAIRQAGEFGGPVGRGDAEMAEIRDFYGRLALGEGLSTIIRVTDPDRDSSSLVPISLPSI